ncbi:hypothetical protein FGE12_06255 [Aggregicoccus sp. 17bor-14]|uniref:hypothetical protein n=1 Tax=Myxococcaceae TaxID=31 RepID=UPI00129CAFDB|nr:MULTISPECIES: hypothetical protein [Myxococcaceae]MBF5041989.1 hypothetical protein [Simulacricoccus sp. 17bor-14]MRI87769.1 hypothetical protein [Aggregicoccus sp. 17bor-14]
MSAYRRYVDQLARAKLRDFLKDPQAGDEGWREADPDAWRETAPGEGEAEGDDAMRRMIAAKTLWGTRTPEAMEHLARVSHQEAQRWAPQLASPLRAAPGVDQPAIVGGANAASLSWVNLGPTNASFEYNGSLYSEVDSGRVNAILVSPADTRIAYLGTSGGGVWKTFEMGNAKPTWYPVAETLGNLAIGALDLDPQAPDTLYAGLGDFVDTPGGQVVKSTDGAATWGAPVSLSGQYPAGSGGLSVKALRIRALRVDPTNSNVVLVGTDVGLFRSTDAGASYSLVDLPNQGTTQKPESVWSIVYTGAVNGVSRWALSGVYACDAASRPPDAGVGQASGATGCTAGNPGDLWTSSDAGATWSSRKAAGAIPTTAVGRLTLGAGTPSATAVTVVYAQLGNQDEYNAPAGAGYWRSTDSGATWVAINGTLANATNSVGGARDCGTVNVNAGQAWYNSAVAVDPANDNNVLIGGMLCGLRTSNGLSATPTWENVSHWLPSGGGGNVTGGTLDYVHADWHAALIVRTATGYLAMGGSDGGLFVSSNLFNATPPQVVWNGMNQGIVTHLGYSMASGDPATGNSYLAYTGLQDNGTRFRDPAAGASSTTFNQVIGGDGFGAAASKDPSSSATVYWASVNGSRRTCVPTSANSFCNAGTAWTTKNATPLSTTTCPGEGQPFIIRYAVAQASPSVNTVLTATNGAVHRVSGTGAWAAISPCLTGATRNLAASPTIDGLYGVAMSGGRFYVTSNCTGTTTACTWTQSSVLGFDANGDGTLGADEKVSYTSMVSFPPATPAGKTAGDVYVAASAAPLAGDGKSLVSDALGHLFITTNRGASWAPLHGNGTGFDLPNVGIGSVRYDPGDTANNTLYVGTELGVYRSIDGGQTWRRFGNGLPMASVTDMFISRTGSMLRVSTFGRGLWEIYPSATAEKGVNGTGDWNRDQQLDFIDLAAMASRLGTSPATTEAPLYDWNVDVTGTVSGTDDADLTQLLNKFGGRP